MTLHVTHQDLVEIHEVLAQHARERGDEAAVLRHEAQAQGWRDHIKWRTDMADRAEATRRASWNSHY